MNYVFIAGHLGADAEERFTATGKRVVSLRIACKVRQGGKDDTIWWRVNIWNDRFDKMIPYLRKGSGVIVIGEMSKPETYVDKEGNTRVSLTLSAESIKFSPFGKPSDRSGQQQEGGASFGGAPTASPTASPAAAEQFATYATGANGGTAPDQNVGDDLPF
ncbi:MAG: Single-stranded DNA-binding protein [Chlamydiae bacterium]|nr:Single-stranded DNA-binding protein [Chlamydiota bacterium]